MKPCVIYCRVSSERQVREGNGLSSQEQRCRNFAEAQKGQVLRVFRDEGVSGAILNRPGIKELLQFLKAHRSKEPTLVIVDDISRIARDVQTHILLRAKVESCGGKLVSPSFNFDDNAMGEFMEVIFAGIAQYGRSGNREQVLNRMKSRLEMGFWTFPAPPGYTYAKDKLHAKVVVPESERAPLIQEALEGFAKNRFQSQRDIVRFLLQRGYYGKSKKRYVSSYDMAVKRILDNITFYAGYIEYPSWGVERREGRHKPLIDKATLFSIQEKLSGRIVKSPRTDYKEEFLLRNFVRCVECGHPLTASKVKAGRYPRYHCYYQGHCSMYGRVIHPIRLHGDFESLLAKLEASDTTMDLVRVALEDVWQERVDVWGKESQKCRKALERTQESIGAVIRRMSREEDEEIAEEFEKELKRLRAEKLVMERQVAGYEQKPPNFAEAYEKVGTMLQNPLLIWKQDSLELKKTVCRLAFTVPPAYDRLSGFGTTIYSLPYQITQHLAGSNSRMVDFPRNTWDSLYTIILEWAGILTGLEEKLKKEKHEVGWLSSG